MSARIVSLMNQDQRLANEAEAYATAPPINTARSVSLATICIPCARQLIVAVSATGPAWVDIIICYIPFPWLLRIPELRVSNTDLPVSRVHVQMRLALRFSPLTTYFEVSDDTAIWSMLV